MNGENLLLDKIQQRGEILDSFVNNLHSKLGLDIVCLFAVNMGSVGCLRARWFMFAGRYNYGLTRDLQNSGYFETEEHHRIFKELKEAIKLGRLVALSGIVGCGKTVLLRRIQEVLVQEREILVSKSLSVDKGRVNLGTLIMALFYDLATEKDFKIPVQPEKRERKLRDLIRRRNKPIALFIDEAHDLHSKTLVGLKRLIEVVQDGGGIIPLCVTTRNYNPSDPI